jgi:inorganic pyrophosphatase
MASQRLNSISRHISQQQYSTIQSGAKYTAEFKAYCQLPNGQIGSFFHDIPLNLNKEKRTVQVLIEIPRWSNAKFEINTKTPFNPITQDTKNGELRFVKNLFPFKGYIHNYGAIPQTWDDPTVTDCETGYKGDNDPIDICEIGSRVARLGDVYEAKILGALALIDDGELDWKVIVIDTRDPLAKELDDIKDVELEMPGLLDATRRWFREYKVPDGKPNNDFGYDEQFLNASKAMDVIEHSHASWKKLVEGRADLEKYPKIENITLTGTPGYTSSSVEIQQTCLPDGKIPVGVEKSYFV